MRHIETIGLQQYTDLVNKPGDHVEIRKILRPITVGDKIIMQVTRSSGDYTGEELDFDVVKVEDHKGLKQGFQLVTCVHVGSTITKFTDIVVAPAPEEKAKVDPETAAIFEL